MYHTLAYIMKIGKVIKAYRIHRELGLRPLAKEIGISHATLSRIERNEKVDGTTMVKLWVWLFT